MENLNFIKLAETLIRFPSTKNNPKARKEIVEFLVNYLKKDKIFIKKFSHQGVFSLVLTLRNEKNPKVFLSGHLDVVEADKKDFIPKLKAGKLYGRGAADMKTQDAIMIEVLRYFSKQSPKPSLGLMLTGDEEVGGMHGTGFLLKEKKYGCGLAIVPDGGKDLSHLVVGEKGVLHLKISFSGKSAHGARPYLGDNALEHLIRAYSKIRKLVPPLKESKWKKSLNLGKIEGGTVPNKVPDKAYMLLDFRLVKPEEEKRILEEVEKIVKEEKGKVEILAKGMPMIQDPKNIFIKKWIEVAENTLKKKIIFQKDDASSDARFFKEKGIQVIMTRPKFANNHAPNEWIDISQSSLFYQMLISYLKNIFKN